MSTLYPQLRKTLETRDWKKLVGLFQKWPVDEDRDEALRYASHHLESWPVETRVATKKEGHPCWELVRHWKPSRLTRDNFPTLQKSKHLRMLTVNQKYLATHLFGDDIRKKCKHLTHLFVPGRLDQTTWNATVTQCKQLEWLKLEENNLQDIKHLKRLAQLHTLSLGRCSGTLNELNPIQKLPRLRHFSIKTCLAESLPSLHELEELESLDIDTTLLGSLEPLRGRDSLRRLRLAHPGKQLSLSVLSTLHGLEELTLTGFSSLQELPSLQDLTRLEELSLRYCHELEELHLSLPALTSLTIEHCLRLKTLETKDCPNLKHLQLEGNKSLQST